MGHHDELEASSAISWEVPEGNRLHCISTDLNLKGSSSESGRLNNDDAKLRSFFHASEAIAGKLESALKNNDEGPSILLQHLKKLVSIVTKNID